MDRATLVGKIKREVPGAVLEKQRFGRSDALCLWFENRKALELARFLETLKYDWLENFSVMQMDDALVLTYFVRSSETSAEPITLRSTLEILSGAQVSNVQLEVRSPSVRSVWTMAEPMEMEADELFGIRFLDENGSPIARAYDRLPAGWAGFPLRKDYVFPESFEGIRHARSGAQTADVVPEVDGEAGLDGNA